jgi:hypothetical protein
MSTRIPAHSCRWHGKARSSFGHHTIDSRAFFAALGVKNHDVNSSYLHGEEIT